MVPGIPTMPPTMAMPYMQLGGELLIKQCMNNGNHPYGINGIPKGFSPEVLNHYFRLVSFSDYLVCIYHQFKLPCALKVFFSFE
jgi:hypothetical protein